MVEKKKKPVTEKSKSVKKKKEDADKKLVAFNFYAPEIREVYIAGDFNGWDTCSLPMQKGKDGIWKVQIRLSPGCYEYKLFADKCWVEGVACSVEVDSECTSDISGYEMVYNPLGTKNCVFRVS
jgi:1,4-alpha-glucan branching enzyme